jgi:hypothetical protein
VDQKTALPAVCCTCSAESARTVEVASTLNYSSGAEVRGITEASEDRKMFSLLLLLVSPFTFLLVSAFGMFRGEGTTGASVCVKVKMRQCKPCSRNVQLEPQTVDYDYHKMRFVVTKPFMEAFQKANAAL